MLLLKHRTNFGTQVMSVVYLVYRTNNIEVDMLLVLQLELMRGIA